MMLFAGSLAALLAAPAEPAVARGAAHPDVSWQKAAGSREAAALDPTQYRSCAEQFEAVARELGPGHPRAGEASYEAARCHEAGGAVGPALRIDEELAEKHGAAAVGRLALAAVARERLALGRFALAAEAFERYAERYAADKSSAEFLGEAARLRSGLGQYDRAKVDLERIEKTVARSQPYTAAEAFWARRELLPAAYASDKARRAHAETYLKVYGSAGGSGRRLLAVATIGEIDWRASCKLKQAGPLGLCVELERDQQTFCDRPVSKVTVSQRDRKLADAAAAAFRQVVADAQKLPAEQLQDDPRLRDVAAMAAIRLADGELETYLDVHMPSDLGFTVEEWRRDSKSASDRALYEKQRRKSEDSKRRFLQFYQDKTRLGEALRLKYEAIVAARTSAAGSIAAAARAGVMMLDYADELMQSDVDLPAGREMRQAFCEEISRRAEPIYAGAIAALSQCLTRASVLGEWGDVARLCEEELQRRATLAFPPLRELFAAGQASGPQEPESIGVQALPYGFGEQ